ncbi:caspase family protein [Nodosilinea sp. E11]|uniref:nSTAND1 domain-containing NTPase n=1 Tax=Nodosilinea sp. E11 TaxID=3037479 RepID=UPI002934ADB0|nr:caspase family protein [Nodosilinea sp. E11]WOD37499.1 caspase family protein [Nodosilinea sp. E11]
MSRDALVVGINTYQYLPSLQAPAQDAEAVARCLESFGECRVGRLPEAITHQKPTISQRGAVTTPMLEEALIRLFKPAGKNIPQTAIFYYSGHGLQRQAGIQEGYLATSDANPATGHYGLSLHWLRRLLQESPVRQRVILLDCCNSGEFFNMLEADPGARAGTDRLFMAAAREYEAAYEALDSHHSVFTQALLSGLNPYTVKGGIVNGHSLTDLVNRELKGELQQPLFESSGGEIVLTRAAGLMAPAPDTAPSLIDRLQGLRYRFCPFPGAAPFEAGQREFFFGRDEITQTLVEQVRTSRLCALVGASGSGKTSLLQAGLMPRLSEIDDALPWEARYLTLGPAPLTNLAEAFVEAQATGLARAEQLRWAESFLQQGPEGFCQLVQAVAGATPLVLVIDQFEVLLTPGLVPDRDRRLVIDCLTAAIQQDCLPLHLVLGLRASHLQSLSDFPDFESLVHGHTLAMPAMTYNQLKATIVGPLEKVGYRYDTNLVYTLLLDVVSAPADLALLQLALKALWSRREVNPSASEPPRLTLAAYADMGGIRHLLNQQANDLYDSLSAAEQAIAQRVFLSLCDLGDGAALSRRQIALAELVTETMPQAAVVSTLEKLINARLVVSQAPAVDLNDSSSLLAVPGWSPASTEGDALMVTSSLLVNLPLPLVGDPYFDIAHEALIRNWPLLQQWLQAQGPMVRQQRTIEVAAQSWQHHQQPNHPDYFLTKTRLNEAKVFRQTHPGQLSVLAIRYLEACDRYTRRCCRQRYLVRLLIPLSMATGMVTAYGHSHMTRPDLALTLAEVPPGMSDVVPSFQLVPPALESSPAPILGSPQTGVVRTDLLNLAPGAIGGHSPQPHHTAASDLLNALDRSAQGFRPMATQAAALNAALQREVPSAVASAQPVVPQTAPVQTAPIQVTPKQAAPGSASAKGHSLPAANQVVDLEAWWISPSDPSLVIQIWCTRTQPEPVCFTSTAARSH